MNDDKELNQLLLDLITESNLSEEAKSGWKEALASQGPSSELFKKLQQEVMAAATQAQDNLSDELVHIAGEANEIEHQFNANLSAVTAGEKDQAKAARQKAEEGLLAKIRSKLNS